MRILINILIGVLSVTGALSFFLSVFLIWLNDYESGIITGCACLLSCVTLLGTLLIDDKLEAKDINKLTSRSDEEIEATSWILLGKTTGIL